MGLECPWAEHHVTVSSTGIISTCCMSVPVIDVRTGQPYNIKTHTISEAYNSAEFNSIRQNLRNSIKDKNCNHCWVQEDSGERSLRQDTIPEYQEVYNSGKTSGLLTVQLDLSNQCNLKCRTCNPSDSSMWVKEHYDLHEDHRGLKLIEFQRAFNTSLNKEYEFFEDFKNNIIPSLVIVRFQGGEPFLIKRQWEMIDSMIESGHSKDIVLGYHTNGTIWNQDIEHKLSQFKEVNICLSIDDIGHRFEYLRHPADWNQVSSNIENMLSWKDEDSDNRDFLINCVITPYNLLTISELLDYFFIRHVPVKLHPTSMPEHFSISNIPVDLKETFLTKLQSRILDKEMENVIAVLNRPGSQTQWEIFLNVTRMHDKYRSEDYAKTFPEFFEVIRHHV